MKSKVVSLSRVMTVATSSQPVCWRPYSEAGFGTHFGRRGGGRSPRDCHRWNAGAPMALHRRRPLTADDGVVCRTARTERTDRPDRAAPGPYRRSARGTPFDAATLIGVLHHLPGDDAKSTILRSLAARLNPGAPLILAGNRYPYASQPLLLAAWAERWRMHGATADEVKAKHGKILNGADPPRSDEHVAELLNQSGFGIPTLFFSSLFWGAWIACRTADPS